MSKTLQSLRATRPWIDDERGNGNCILVTLATDCYFACKANCGVMGFDTAIEVRTGTAIKQS